MQRPTIIAFASPKGGVGKSTSCLNIAGGLARAGYPVHIMDLDQTQTLSRWYQNHGESLTGDAARLTISSSSEGAFPEQFKKVLQNQMEKGGFILLDLAGSFGETMLKAATLADLTITPSKLSEPDIIEATKLSARISQLAKEVDKVIRHRILINEVPSLLPSFMKHIIDQLPASGLQRFTTMISTRAAYPEAMMTGQTPHFADQTRPAISKAVAELNDLLSEISAVLHDEEWVKAEEVPEATNDISRVTNNEEKLAA